MLKLCMGILNYVSVSQSFGLNILSTWYFQFDILTFEFVARMTEIGIGISGTEFKFSWQENEA